MKADLREVDLNLLLALEALLSERNVTRAAEKIGIGQSAMSSSLARLRKLFDDELLTRGPDGMRITPKGAEMLEPVSAILGQIQGLWQHHEKFEPSTFARTLHVSLSDGSEILLLTKLLRYLREHAPNVRLITHQIQHDTLLDQIDAGAIDLAIGQFSVGRHHHKKKLLFRDEYVCIFNATYFDWVPPITLEQYVSAPHVMTTLRGRPTSLVDDALARMKLKRDVVFVTPRFTSVPMLVSQAPVISTVHRSLAHYFSEFSGYSSSPVPIELEPVQISMVWHASHSSNPGHEWIRKAISHVASDFDRERNSRGNPGTATNSS